MEEGIVLRWERSGLLDGITSLEDRLLLSKYLDRSAKIVILKVKLKDDLDYFLTFPIIKRVFNVHKHIDVDDIIKELIEYHKKKYHLYSELYDSQNTDYDKLFCEHFSNHYSSTWKPRLIKQRFKKR